MMYKNALLNKPIIIIDFEATCVDNNEEEIWSEIIEFAAVKVNEKGELIDEFTEFIKPIVHPRLSKYCTDLTTITQEQVDKADEFPEVYKRFLEWKGDTDLWGSWGRYDYRQLKDDCGIHDIPFTMNNHINLKQVYSDLFKFKRCGLARAIKQQNLKFEGTHHRGIDDCRNIYKIYVNIINKIKKMEVKNERN